MAVLDRHLLSQLPLSQALRDSSESGGDLGEGTVSGELLSGSIKWPNHPSLRSDGVALLDFPGA